MYHTLIAHCIALEWVECRMWATKRVKSVSLSSNWLQHILYIKNYNVMVSKKLWCIVCWNGPLPSGVGESLALLLGPTSSEKSDVPSDSCLKQIKENPILKSKICGFHSLFYGQILRLKHFHQWNMLTMVNFTNIFGAQLRQYLCAKKIKTNM